MPTLRPPPPPFLARKGTRDSGDSLDLHSPLTLSEFGSPLFSETLCSEGLSLLATPAGYVYKGATVKGSIYYLLWVNRAPLREYRTIKDYLNAVDKGAIPKRLHSI